MESSRRVGTSICALALMLMLCSGTVLLRPALADEGGVSFWVPGFFGSLAAAPQDPGWSLATVYYHTSPSANAGASFVRGGSITAGIDARANLLLLVPSYVFSTPVLGGQASIAVLGTFGRMNASASATLTGPGGGTLSATRSDTLTGFGDMAPMASLRWNAGVHNFMTYVTAGVPVGAYQSGRLANLGIGHWALDVGGGYTYLDPAAGHELSAVAGFTRNFENPSTRYRNGVDFHFDWGASQFLSKELLIGAVGYAYNQITGDSGAGAVLGGLQSRVFGVGPQIGYFIPMGEAKGYLNLKGYREFGSANRPEGWNMWLTFSIIF